jgi:hypothetical protein
MSSPNAGCCSVTLAQQRQSAHHQYQQQSCQLSLDQPRKPVSLSTNLTVIENGRVVVKPRGVEPSEDANQPAQ